MPSSPPIFRSFDERGELRIYHRNLPHWRQPGATYFVTFRQADSIPQSIIEHWDRQLGDWLRAHGINPSWKQSHPKVYLDHYSRIPAHERHDFERVVVKLLHHELDTCHGSCVLRDPANATLVREALLHFHGSRAWIGDFVIMPNHVHAIIQAKDGHELEDLLESVKKFTARRILASLRETKSADYRQSFWQPESYDRIIRDLEELSTYRHYIAKNPIKANLREGEFIHHTCTWLP
jgi:REP element-mobilizing transposase RayT